MKVVIVESPGKTKTINKYLGKGYEVMASVGHIRDLPAKDGSVDPDQDFAMLWEVDSKASKRVSDIAKAVKDSDGLILATDPDREGEAISWHVLEVLKQKRALKDVPVERVVFNAITKDAITEAMKHPRQIDQPLVDAYLARRALDYLVGFNLSPVLWRKLPGARSAGRVQSVALRILSDRELEIEKFVRQEYWSILAHLKTKDGAPFTARLIGADGKKIQRLDVGSEAEAAAFRAALDSAKYTIRSIEAKPAKRHPYAPFTTSTLQQEASRKLGFAPAHTMRVAQKLYEGVDIDGETLGLITYMRTDGVDMAPEAVASARRVIGDEFGPRYVPDAPRRYSAKAKNAQEAHEAIRPTDLARLPKKIRKFLEPDQARLYELIWTRTIASQMESALLERTTIDIAAEAGARELDLRATGQVVRFDGFLALYQEGKDDDDDEEGGRLPPMAVRDPVTREKIDIAQHFTEPPPRYSEASLIKRMEELGIGRPSTYASTIAVLKDREYVRVDKKKLVPEDKGRLVTAFLESFFKRYVEYDFTADLEEKLDQISNGDLNWKQVLSDFWQQFNAAIGETRELRTTQVLDNLNALLGPHIFPARADGGDPRLCPTCGSGQLSLKLGKFGAFIGCSNYPECKFTRQFSASGEEGAAPAEGERPGVKSLGQDPKTGEDITLRDGRFGPYIQQGEGDKPKRSSLPKGLSPAQVTLEKALALLSLPREVARHPADGEPILAGIGRYGPYLQHGKTYANLGKDDDVLEIGGNRAIDLIVAKQSGAGTGSRFGGTQSSGTALGEHPNGGTLTLRDGRYGAYISWGKVNATLPKGTDKANFSLSDAIALVNAKASGEPTAASGRVLGEHPLGGTVTVRDGRYGPYINVGKTNVNLPKGTEPQDMTLSVALALIDEKGYEPEKPKTAKKAAAESESGTTKKAPAKAGAKAAAKPKAAAKKPATKRAAANKSA